MSNPQGQRKGSKPQLHERQTQTSTVVPTTGAARRPFTRNLTINVGARKYLVIGGLGPKDSDGREPYIPPQRIAQKLNLDMRECIMADPREIGKIEAARAHVHTIPAKLDKDGVVVVPAEEVRLKEYGVKDIL